MYNLIYPQFNSNTNLESQKLFDLLINYIPKHPKEEADKLLMLSYLNSCDRPFERTTLPSHFTGSALLASKDFSKILLNHHLSLDKWIQFGGHADGNADLLSVAKRELEEESGILTAEVYDENIFDVDIQLIPANHTKGEPDHYHLDVRFLFVTEADVKFEVSHESLEMQWVNVADTNDYNNDFGFVKMIEKLRSLV